MAVGTAKAQQITTALGNSKQSFFPGTGSPPLASAPTGPGPATPPSSGKKRKANSFYVFKDVVAPQLKQDGYKTPNQVQARAALLWKEKNADEKAPYSGHYIGEVPAGLPGLP